MWQIYYILLVIRHLTVIFYSNSHLYRNRACVFMPRHDKKGCFCFRMSEKVGTFVISTIIYKNHYVIRSRY